MEKLLSPFLCHIRDVPFLLGILTAPHLYLLLVPSRMESFFPGLANIRLLWASGKHPGISRKLLPWHTEEHCWSEGQGLLVFSYAISVFLFSNFFFLPFIPLLCENVFPSKIALNSENLLRLSCSKVTVRTDGWGVKTLRLRTEGTWVS